MTSSTTTAAVPRRGSFKRKLAFFALSSLVTVGLAEWALRALNIERLHPTNPDLYQADDELTFTMKPDVTMRSHGTWIDTNRHGFRGPSWDDVHAEGKRCVMFLGDSVTVGYGVDYEECFVSRFSEKNSRNLVGVCLGLCGYNYSQEIALGQRHLADIEPVATVLMFVGNDFEEPYAIFEPRVDATQGGVLEPVKRLLRRNSVLYTFLRKRIGKLRGGDAQGHESWVDEELIGDTPESLAHFDALERGIREIMEATNAPLVLALFPLGVPDECTERLREVAEKTGAHWLDFSLLWDNIPDYLATASLGWDGHPSADAHDQMADLIVQAVEEALREE